MRIADDAVMERLTDNRNWGADPLRAPQPEERDIVVFSEHGRIIGKTDYRSHWLMLVKNFSYSIVVKHGAGQERFPLPMGADRYGIPDVLENLDSDGRYLMLYGLYRLYTETKRHEEARTAAYYRKAFVEGRLKKFKIRGRDAYKVKVIPEAR